MSNGDIKINMIKSQNKTYFDVLKSVVEPKSLYGAAPRLQGVAEARQEHKNIMETMRQLGQVDTDFMHYVAQIDVSVWSIILEIFARQDPKTKEFMDDGLLYVTDPDKGCVVLNKVFFYALISILEDANYVCDMRGKAKVTI